MFAVQEPNTGVCILHYNLSCLPVSFNCPGILCSYNYHSIDRNELEHINCQLLSLLSHYLRDITFLNQYIHMHAMYTVEGGLSTGLFLRVSLIARLEYGMDGGMENGMEW